MSWNEPVVGMPPTKHQWVFTSKHQTMDCYDLYICSDCESECILLSKEHGGDRLPVGRHWFGPCVKKEPK